MILFPLSQIQIHGPVCLSENVDCIVVNDRHSADTAMRELLDEFVTRNKCNLIWMERADRIDYPSFTHAPAHFPPFIPPPALPAPMFAAAPLPPGNHNNNNNIIMIWACAVCIGKAVAILHFVCERESDRYNIASSPGNFYVNKKI